MKRWITALVLAAFLFPRTVYAEDKQVSDVAISPLRKKQRAPFVGILFTPRAAATLITEVELINDKIAIEVKKAVDDVTAKKDFEHKEAATKCTTDKKVLQASVETADARIQQLEGELKRAEKATADAIAAAPKRSTWTTLGFVGGVVVTVATVFAVNQASK